MDRDRDIWLDMDRQVMDSEIRFENQSIIWIMGLGLSFKRAPYTVKKERNKKKIHELFISHIGVSVLIHPSTSPLARSPRTHHRPAW